MTSQHDFLASLYDDMHRTPMQEHLRRLAPMPVGVVFIEHPGMTEGDIRAHFRRIRQLGFSCLKGIHLCPGTDLRHTMHMALDEGLIPWWYDEGGWEPITDALLRRLGIPADTPMAQIRSDPRMRAYQEQVLRRRIDVQASAARQAAAEDPEDDGFSFDMTVSDAAVSRFADWLRRTYGTPERLAEAWNMHYAMIRQPERPWRSWDDVAASLPHVLVPQEYRRLRDVIRFKADLYLERVRRRAEAHRAADPHAPFRAGGEMGLFLPFAARATDMEGIAHLMAEYGSFYPSIHLAWHFEEVDFEVTRPVYMQASLAQDWFKGGWAATWESTGGPQQLSGGKGWTPEAAQRTAGFTVDAGVITQLMLSYLAAGFKGFGFWCWTPRTAGWEAGEYSLLDRSGEPSPRAVAAGRIGQAARRLRDELWQARKEPLVGIFTDFENDAFWAALSVGGRDKFKHVPMQARVGAARALINHNVPWEHVTASDLETGLGPRYRVLYLPVVLALPERLQQVLADYAAGGGRLVMDLPGAWYDGFGRLLPTGVGSWFERTFGCTLRDMQYSSNVPRYLAGRRLEGFVADIAPTRAAVVERFDDGRPAATEVSTGNGAAVFLAFEASLACFRPGCTPAEAALVGRALGPYRSPYACTGAIAYRLAAPAADHYFLINDGPATSAILNTGTFRYSRWTDALSGEPLTPGAPLTIDAYSGRWIRCEK